MNWSDISLRKYVDLTSIKENSELNSVEKMVEIGKLLIDPEIDSLTPGEYAKEIRKLDFLYQPVPYIRPEKEMIVGDCIMKFPSDLSKLTMANYIDYSNLIRQNGNKIDINNIAETIAAICSFDKDIDFEDKVQLTLDNVTVPQAMAMARELKKKSVKYVRRFLAALIWQLAKEPIPIRMRIQLIRLMIGLKHLILSIIRA